MSLAASSLGGFSHIAAAAVTAVVVVTGAASMAIAFILVLNADAADQRELDRLDY